MTSPNVSSGRPPALSVEALSRVACKHFNFGNVQEDSVKNFPAYDGRNYYFRGQCRYPKENGSEFVLKLMNPVYNSLEEIKIMVDFMKYIHLQGFPYSTPRVLTSTEGEDIVLLSHHELTGESNDTTAVDQSNGLEYPVSIFSYVEGDLFDCVEKKFLTSSLLNEVGRMIGTFNRDIGGDYTNEDMESQNNYNWDLLHFLSLKKYLPEVEEDPMCRNNAVRVFQGFEENISPKLATLKTGMIHGDLNGLNIILKDMISTNNAYHLVGFIDLGDSIKTCTIFDLAIALAYTMLENLEPVTCSSVVEFVGPLIGGYNSALPLTADEMDSLYWLVLARCTQSGLNGKMAYKAEPWNDYLLTTPKKAWMLIEHLVNIPKLEVDKVWKSFIN